MTEKPKIIMDLDGTIVDSEPFQAKSSSLVVAEITGKNFELDEMVRRYNGTRSEDWVKALCEEHGQTEKASYFAKKRWGMTIDLIRKEKKESLEIEGATHFIKRMFGLNYDMAISSSSNMEYINVVLDKLGIKNYFNFLISGDMLKEAKPNPEAFLICARKFKQPVDNCIVFEDSQIGIETAKRAKMKCVVVGKTIKNFHEINELNLVELASRFNF